MPTNRTIRGEVASASTLAEICAKVLKVELSEGLDEDEDYNAVFDYGELSTVKSFMLRELERVQSIDPFISIDILTDRAIEYLLDYRVRHPEFPRLAVGYGSTIRSKRK